MAIGIPKNYFQSTSKPHIVTDIELDESVNAIHDIEDDISAKMNGTTGHSHSGSDSQGPTLAEGTSVVFHDSTGHKHAGTGSDGTNIPWAGLDSAIKSDDNPADIATTPAAGSASKFSRSDHVHDHVASLGVDLHHTEDHASRHSNSGADEITHNNLGTVGTDNHHAKIHASTHHTSGDDLLAHQSIPGSGTNTHTTIDTHLSATNPHSGSASVDDMEGSLPVLGRAVPVPFVGWCYSYVYGKIAFGTDNVPTIENNNSGSVTWYLYGQFPKADSKYHQSSYKSLSRSTLKVYLAAATSNAYVSQVTEVYVNSSTGAPYYHRHHNVNLDSSGSHIIDSGVDPINTGTIQGIVIKVTQLAGASVGDFKFSGAEVTSYYV